MTNNKFIQQHLAELSFKPYYYIILFVGDIADLIFVFFDPIGQALCKRTLTLVEKLNEKHAERMRFYLSKADEAGHEADRQVTDWVHLYIVYKVN